MARLRWNEDQSQKRCSFVGRDKVFLFPAFLLAIACNVPYAGLQIQNHFVCALFLVFSLLTYPRISQVIEV